MTSFGATLAICLYLGWGIATSPLPIAGLLVMLLSKRAKATAWAFTVTWLACQLVAISVFTVVARALASIRVTSSEKDTLAGLMLAVAAAMVIAGLVLVIKQRRHPDPNSGEHTREFLAKAADAGPRQAAGIAVTTAVLNVTNVPYWVGIGLMIHRSRLPLDDRVVLVVLSSIAASLTFILATLAVVVLGGRAERALNWGRDTLVKHSGSVVPSFLLISGACFGLLAAYDLGWL